MIKNIMNNINELNHDRSGKWDEHKRNICVLIEKSREELKLEDDEGSILIYGAGRCDDLDFEYLSKAFKHISLVDIDEKTLKNSVEKLPESILSKIKVLPGFDFSALDEIGYYEEFKNNVQEGNSKSIIKFVRKVVPKLNKAEVDLEHKYDVVLSTAVYTQLCYMPSLMILAPFVSKFTKKEINNIKDELVYLTHAVLENYNKLLIESTKENSSLVVVTDLIEISSSMPYGNIVNPNSNSLDHEVVDRLLASGFGLVGAKEGLSNIINNIRENTIYNSEWIWNFSGERRFYTKGISGLIK